MQFIDATPELNRGSARDPAGSLRQEVLAEKQATNESKIRGTCAFAEEPAEYGVTAKPCVFVPRHRRLTRGHRVRVHAKARPYLHDVAAACRAAELHDNPRHDDLERQLRELTEKNSRLEELNRLCSAYIADVAHELRNSLLTLQFYLELLAKGRHAKQEHYQRMALQSVERLRHFVEETLSLSRLEFAGTQRGELVPLDLEQLVCEIVRMYSAQAEAAGLSLQFESAGALPPVMGDPTLLTQVIVNLVTNAIKYTNSGWIQVKTRVLSMTNEVIIDVTDSGIGIAESDLPYIFERFYRSQDVQDHVIPGTGLGLAIVKEIVTLHRGEISVDSAPGVGSRFRVRLPVA